MSKKDNNKGLQMLHNTPEKDENTTNNREDEYEWGKHPNSVKALKQDVHLHTYP